MFSLSVPGNALPTASENQTNVGVAYLDAEPASSSWSLVSDSYGARQGYICKFSGYSIPPLVYTVEGWLGSRVVSVLDSGAEGPGTNRSRDAVG